MCFDVSMNEIAWIYGFVVIPKIWIVDLAGVPEDNMLFALAFGVDLHTYTHMHL